MQCEYILPVGRQCKRKSLSSTYCWQHFEQEQKLDYIPTIVKIFKEYKNRNQKLELDALNFINSLIISIYYDLNIDRLEDIVRSKYSTKSYLQNSLLKLITDDLETSKDLIINTFIEYLIRVLVKYSEHISYKDVNYAINNNS